MSASNDGRVDLEVDRTSVSTDPREAESSNLVARLRARTIIVPKPGTEPFVPTQPFWVTSDAGPHQAGEEAGLQYLPSFSTLGSSNAPMRVQAHVYVVEPLCEEAAEEIERLRAALADAIMDIREYSGEVTPGLDARLTHYQRCVGGGSETQECPRCGAIHGHVPGCPSQNAGEQK